MAHIQFRRIGGRIVPIKMDNENKARAKSVAVVGAGLGIGHAAGKYGARLAHESALQENVARGSASKYWAMKAQKGMTNEGVIHQGHRALHEAAVSMATRRASFGVRNAGAAYAGALIAIGVNHGLNANGKKENKKTKATVAAGAGVAAAFAIRQAYTRGVGGSKPFRSAFKKLVLKV